MLNTLLKSGRADFTVKDGINTGLTHLFLREQILGCRLLPSEIRLTLQGKKIFFFLAMKHVEY